MLKILKVSITLNLKADATDPDDVKERLYETLQFLIEGDELEWTLGDDEEEVENEE